MSADLAGLMRYGMRVVEPREGGIVSACAPREIDGVIKMERDHGGKKVSLREIPLSAAKERGGALHDLLAHAGLHLQE